MCAGEQRGGTHLYTFFCALIHLHWECHVVARLLVNLGIKMLVNSYSTTLPPKYHTPRTDLEDARLYAWLLELLIHTNHPVP